LEGREAATRVARGGTPGKPGFFAGRPGKKTRPNPSIPNSSCELLKIFIEYFSFFL
jgi:hypothetical protein